MCDTFVALGKATKDGSVIFGKNSDREPNEAHEVVVIPAADHEQGSQVQCTYISLPQVEHTHAVLLAKPFWIWGAEMGMNEHGVTIGNEAIFTKVPYDTEGGLIGMDFLRLGLERAKTAWEALYTITELLELYGQSGNCGFSHPFYYHNSFLIADTQDAWVLETAGKQWVAKKVTDFGSISNAATIGKEWDLSSDNLIPYAMDKGWCKNRAGFDFSKVYSDFLYTTMSDARARQKCTVGLLKESRGRLTVHGAFEVLRSHGLNPSGDRRIDRAVTGANVCMHAGAGPVRGSQSTGSMVAHLTGELNTAWVTATSAPCTGIFKPVWIDTGHPLEEPSPTGTFDPRCIWWRHEELHRAVLKDYPNRIALFENDREALEARVMKEMQDCLETQQSRLDFSRHCFDLAAEAEWDWLARVQAAPVKNPPVFYYVSAWDGFNRQANMGEPVEH